ncbi:MAG: hypothetical protein EXR01_08550 [Acetobacteraceae bacterium]|nr:hypothetical protein [Acetobacteraceae bacterium]
MPDANGLLMAFMEPPSGMEDEFNDWYDTEHLPERMAIRGFLAGHRWVSVHGYPRWVATYFLSQAAVLHSPAYKKVGGANGSPWTTRVTSRTIGRLRVVGERIGKGLAPFDTNTTSRLLTARYPLGRGVKDTALAQVLENTTGAMAEKPQVRIFRGIEASAGSVWLLAAFRQPVGVEALAAQLGEVGGVGAAHFNLYMPHWKVQG